MILAELAENLKSVCSYRQKYFSPFSSKRLLSQAHKLFKVVSVIITEHQKNLVKKGNSKRMAFFVLTCLSSGKKIVIKENPVR